MPEQDRFAVVLVRPQESGNIGAVARAMANMGRSRLVLVDPQAPIDDTARAFAVHARHILDNALVEPDLATALAPFGRAVGTTAGRARVDAAPTLAPDRLAAVLRSDADAAVALVFGGEASGLTTEELTRCHPLISIPCSAAQPTLNLAQAVLLVLYELAKAGLAEVDPTSGEAPEAADQQMIDGLFADLVPLLEATGFARDDTFDSTLRSLRRLAARAVPSRHEASILRGILRRFRNALKPGVRSR